MIGTAMLFSLAAPVPALVDHWRREIDQAAIRFQLPSNWIARVIQVESGGHALVDGRPIRSAKGAMGLMQIMPATWEMLRNRYRLGADPDDPHDNIMAGAGYLRALYDRFGYPALFAAYNAGPARYQDFIWGRASLPAETQAYSRMILGGSRLISVAAAARASEGGRAMRSAPHPEQMLFFTKMAPGFRDGSTNSSACHSDIGLWAVPPPCG